MTGLAFASPQEHVRREIRNLIRAFEALHWPIVRDAWLRDWGTDRCMACGIRERLPGMRWWERRRSRDLRVHHARYPRAVVAGKVRPVRGAGEQPWDLILLCATTKGCRGKGCHMRGRLRGHSRWTRDLPRLTWRHVRARRRRYWYRNPPTPAWAWQR